MEDLSSAPRPKDEVAGRIHDSLTSGSHVDSMVPVMRLLGQVPWTTKSVEDPHNVSQSTMRKHPALQGNVDASVYGEAGRHDIP